VGWWADLLGAKGASTLNYTGSCHRGWSGPAEAAEAVVVAMITKSRVKNCTEPAQGNKSWSH